MVSAITLLKKFAHVNKSVIESYNFVQNPKGEDVLKIHLRPYNSEANRCPICGKRCPVYDRCLIERKWRCPDFGGVIVELYSPTCRVDCPEHGVKTASVPWSFHDSGFTRDFDLLATFLGMHTNRSTAAQLLRCDWHTIMRCISRTREYLEPNPRKRYDGLENIGIDETSFRKGHSYITVVVNHDTNTVVWCAPGHSTEVLSRFFEELTEAQRKSIRRVSGDGAKWIDACIEKYIPHAVRCVDSFHVVTWAMDALDELRKEAWREAYAEQKTLSKEAARGKGRPRKSDKAAKKLSDAQKKATEIKTSTYTLGKAPENLTQNQANKLELIAKTNPRLYRAYKLKEQLRMALKMTDKATAKLELDRFFWRGTHSRIQVFKELAYKIRRHEEHILNTIETRLSNARVESINRKIKLFINKAYGFKNIQNLLDMILLGCSNLLIPLPNRGGVGLKVA